jgi:signal transduction histidine kinase
MHSATAADARRLPALLYLAAGVTATGIYFLLPQGGDAQSVLYDAIGLSAAAALAAGARIHLPPSRRLPWYLLSAGILLFAIGDAITTVYLLAARSQPTPSASDVFYLAGYPFLFVGIWKLLQRLESFEGRLAALDATILTVAFATAQWVFVMAPLTAQDVGVFTLAILLAYPAMDLLLVAPLARSVITPVWRNWSYRLLVAALALMLLSDELYGVNSSAYVSGSWLDALWLLSYVAWGCAALMPSMASLTQPDEPVEPNLGWTRVAMLGLALLAAPAILVVQAVRGENVGMYVIAAGGALVSLLVLARVGLLLRTVDDAHSDEREARYFAEEAHDQIALQNARLQELDRLKDEFVGLVSHELRTPLTSITGYVELMEEDDAGSLTDEQVEFLSIIRRNARRLLGLVNDLLFVARIEAGRLELTLAEVDLADVLTHAVDSARPRAADRGVSLTLEEDGPMVVLGEAGRLAQLLDNLVSNAIKFTLRDGAVEVRLGRENGRAQVRVTDSGVGIAKEELDHLFERFFRASTAVSAQVPGTGLGLYIAKAIVDAHDGSIDVQSEVGGGTTFHVELPLAETVV